jgi:hypothetical protein
MREAVGIEQVGELHRTNLDEISHCWTGHEDDVANMHAHTAGEI